MTVIYTKNKVSGCDECKGEQIPVAMLKLFREMRAKIDKGGK